MHPRAIQGVNAERRVLAPPGESDRESGRGLIWEVVAGTIVEWSFDGLAEQIYEADYF